MIETHQSPLNRQELTVMTMQARASRLVVETAMVVRDERVMIMLSEEITVTIPPWILTNRIARSPHVCDRRSISMKILLCGD